MNRHTCIITGASGFVGRNLIPYLQQHISEVVPVSLRYTLNPGLLQHANSIVHLAGKAHDLTQTSQPEEYYKVNTKLTEELYQQFLSSDATVFIMLSSVKAAADQIDGVLTEDVLPNPQTVYGKSKLLAEKYMIGAPPPVGKRVYILRPCMIHGPGNKGNLNLLYRFAQTGIPYPLAAFENKRSFLSVGNLCFVINELLQRSDIPSGIYNVADDEPLSTNRVMQLFGEEMGKHVRLLRVPVVLIKTAALAGDKLHLPLNSERLKKLTESYMVSNTKLVEVLQKKLSISAEEGLRNTVRSFIGKS